MPATFQFNPETYSKEALALILAKSQEWNCPPAEAAARLLNEMAKRRAKHAA